MGIRHPLISEIAKDTYLFNEFGLCNHYLLVGTERALLIDCGMGYYDLRATVERMTDKPYDVVITHGHPDHAGMCTSSERVYITKRTAPAPGPRARTLTSTNSTGTIGSTWAIGPSGKSRRT